MWDDDQSYNGNDNEYHLLSIYHILRSCACHLQGGDLEGGIFFILQMRKLRLREIVLLAPTHRASDLQSSIFAQDC